MSYDLLYVMGGNHQCHLDIAKYLGCDIQHISDRVTKEQGKLGKAWRLYKTSMSIRQEYKNILCENNYYYPAIKRRLVGLKSKIISHNCGPLYSHLATGRITGLERKILMGLFGEIDGHIVWGKYGEELLERLGNDKPYRKAYPFIRRDDLKRYLKVVPQLDSETITCMANIDSHCKGLDILLSAFGKVSEEMPKAKLNLVVRDMNREELFEEHRRRDIQGDVGFYYGTKDVGYMLAKTSLYVQPSRADAFPVAPIEAMACGVPVMVSSEVGTKEIVDKVEPEFILKPGREVDALAERILGYLSLEYSEKYELSYQFREQSKYYTDNIRLPLFRRALEELIK